MTRDEELDTILATLDGDLDDAELDRRTARFRGALRRLREDTAEATRIDRLLGDDTTLVAMVSRAMAGEPEAWNAIVERYSPLVWSICTRFALSRADRECVAQRVWLLLIQHLGDLREPPALPGWLATTTSRECVRLVARSSARALADDPRVDEAILLTERNAALSAAFAELPPREQRLLSMLVADPPYSYAEISTTLQIPVGSIGPIRARCLERLRRSTGFRAPAQEQPDRTPRRGPAGTE